MNILITIDKNYIFKKLRFIYFMKKYFQRILNNLNKAKITLEAIAVNNEFFDEFPVTDRYPHAMYYRLLAAQFLPKEVERVLYLDPDIVIINSIEQLYYRKMDNEYFAATTHVEKTLEKSNQVRLNYEEGIYVNSGVLLMNLKELRKEQNVDQIKDYIKKHKDLLILPDQDVLSAIYSDKITEVDAVKYNMTERMWLKEKISQWNNDIQWVEEHCHIIHYIGRNKPWLKDYRGDLDKFYFIVQGYREGFISRDNRK